MRKGSIKVMVGKNGVPRIQEEIGDTVKVYTHEQWQKELKRRETEPVVDETESDISDMDDESENAEVEKPEDIEAKPVKRGRKAKVK